MPAIRVAVIMAKRLQKTLLDYLVIAISPAIIIALVDSLVLFLVEVFYRGGYEGRLEYVLTLFVIGAVLIGRISIEEGRERAVLFAIPLGIVTLLAIGRFVEFQGALAPFSFPINLGLIVLVWWSADKLTWDCTLIDEQEEDSGAGLLETVGLDKPDHAGDSAGNCSRARAKERTRGDDRRATTGRSAGGTASSSGAGGRTLRASGSSIFRWRRCRCSAWASC